MKRLDKIILMVLAIVFTAVFALYNSGYAEDEGIYEYRVLFYFQGTIDEMAEVVNIIMSEFETPVAVQPSGEGYQDHHVVFCSDSETCFTLQGDIEIRALEEVDEQI